MTLLAEPLSLDILQRYRLLKSSDLETLRNTLVRFIAIPMPPSPVRGLLYDPYAYISETFDNVFEKEKGECGRRGYHCIAMLPTNQGPAFYMSAPLSTLITLRKCEALNRYSLEVYSSAFCAHIEYDEKRPRRSLQRESSHKHLVENYADKVRLLGMSLVGRSCHGGSHLIVPGAPYLTALLQMNSAPGDTYFFEENPSDGRVAARYGRPWIEETGSLFPEANWDRNTALDMFISEGFVGKWQAVLKKEDIVVFPYRECIGKWAKPFLQKLTRNILTPLGESNASPTYYSRVRNDLEEADCFNSAPEVGDSLAEGLSINPC